MKNIAALLNNKISWLIVTCVAFAVCASLVSMASNGYPVPGNPNYAPTAKAFAFQTTTVVFRPSTASIPAGTIADNGLAFDTNRGYGWVDPVSKVPVNFTANMRLRTDTGDSKLLGLAQMQPATTGQGSGTWEYVLPNGQYRVTVGAGDAGYFDSDNQINVEGLPAIADFTPDVTHKHLVTTVVVQVSDGKLTIDATGGKNSKIDYITVAAYTTVTDISLPTAGVRLSGTVQGGAVYTNQVQLFAKAIDAGGAGLKTFQYSLNNAAFAAYTSPITIQTAGQYTISVKAIDANNNQLTTTPVTFSVVVPKVSGAYMVLQNTNAFPSNNHLVFSYLQTPWRRTSPDTTPYNANHNIVKLRINNLGTGNLTVTKLALSRPANWSVIAINSDSTSKLPITLTPANFADVSIKFTALNASSRVKIFHDTIYISSNDSIAPLKKVMLDGLWQLHGEGLTEPWTQDIFSLYDYKSTTGFNHDDNGLKGSAVVPKSSEVPASYFVQADPSKPVTVYEIAQYHGCCKAVSPFTYYVKGTSTLKTLFTTNYLDGQSVLPRQLGSNGLLSKATFNSSSSFGFTSDFAIYSDPAKNYMGKIGFRFWKVYDANGNLVPNAFLAGVDYLGTPFSNGDYNDDIYYIDNIKPDAGPKFYSALIATPADMDFGAALVGVAKTLSVNLFNSGMNYAAAGSDPSITIKSVTIVGPNAGEFSVGTATTAAIAAQGSTTLSVKFNPKTLGIKNAALMIAYGNAQPLRVPLYGISNTGTQVVNLIKRYKGGSDVDLRINNQVWTSDKLIRFGSIKLDHQNIFSSVDCTVSDSLYQTYLSAATDLASNNYEIPVANGAYMIRMHFVENYFSAEGQRIFNTSIESQPTLLDFDIYKEVGYRSALVKDFSATVSDGHLSIKFTPTANRLALAGVEIYQAVPVVPIASVANKSALASVDSSQTNPAGIFKLVVYPDPNDGSMVNVNATNYKPNEKVSYTISDMYGKVLKRDSFTVNAVGFLNINVAPVAKLPLGIYIVKSVSASGSYATRFIVR